MANESARRKKRIRIQWQIWLLHKAKWQQHASKCAEARLNWGVWVYVLHVACGVASAANEKRNLLFCKLIQFQFEPTNLLD